MTDATAAVAPGARPQEARRPGRFSLPAPPEWLWALMVGLQVLVTGLLTSYTYFFADDFVFLRQAQTSAFDLAYLRAPLFEHFSPVTRVLNKVLLNVATGSFAAARVIELVMYAAVIAAMAFVLRTILGRGWLAFGLTVLFGQSVFLLRLLTWWTATANLLPATIFMLVATGGYLRWFTGRRNAWLVLALGAYTVALLDYETAMVFPLSLLLIRLIVLSDSFDPRVWAGIVWRERLAWAGFAAFDLAALANYFHRYYSHLPKPTGGQVVHFFDISVLQTFIPGVFGIKQLPSSHTAVAVAAGLAFAVAWAATIYFRPRAWRPLLVLLIVLVITLLPLGLNRIRVFGVSVGAELYYHQSAQFMFIVLAAFAVSPRWGGRRERKPTWIARVPRYAVGALGSAVIVAYIVLLLNSAGTLKTEALLPRVTDAYVKRVKADLARIGHQRGPANLLDLAVPLIQPEFAPFNQDSSFLAVLGLNVTYNDATRQIAVIELDGSLHVVRYRVIASAHLRTAACVPTGRAQLLRLPLTPVERVRPRSGQLPFALRIHYRVPVRTGVPVYVSDGARLAPVDFTPHVWGPGSGAAYVVIGVTRQLRGIAVKLPGGSCVDEASLGTFGIA